jgi:hypothetical protein
MTKMDWDKAKRDGRQVPRAEPASIAWWQTIAKYWTRCSGCGEGIPAKTPYAYNHAEKRSLCSICTDNAGIMPQPSKRLLASRR